jgi:hypothetical protein
MTPLNRRRENGGFAPVPPAHRFVRGLVRIGDASEFVERPELRAWVRSPEVLWLEQIDFTFTTADWFRKVDLPDELHGRIGLTLRVAGMTPAEHRRQFRLLAVSGNFAAVRSLTVLGETGELALEEVTQGDVSHLVTVSVVGDPNQRAAEMIASAPFTSLSSLQLGCLTEAGIRALAASPHLGNLTHLNLLTSTIGDGGMVALCRSPLAHSLRRVEFPNTGISDVGVTALANSPLFAQLLGPRVDVVENRIHDDGLKRLNLQMNRIGDNGLKTLAASEHLLRFRELVLRENVVGDDGVEALAESPYAANLQFLDFWRNKISDRGAKALARSPHLNKVLDLSVKENAVTATGAAELHTRFGDKAKV